MPARHSTGWSRWLLPTLSGPRILGAGAAGLRGALGNIRLATATGPAGSGVLRAWPLRLLGRLLRLPRWLLRWLLR